MPRDKYRLATPESSLSPYIFLPASESSSLVNDKGLRSDGRQQNEVCPLFAKVGVSSQARGSSYLELGSTKVICSVFGPREVTREEFSMTGQLSCDVRLATFSQHRRRQHLQDAEEKDMSHILTEALTPAVDLKKYPKTRIDVFVIVLEDSGSALAAAVSCASLALADAGVQMYDMVVGCSVRQQGELLLVNPATSEEYKRTKQCVKLDGTVCLAYMPQLGQISALVQEGLMDVESVNKATKLCISSCVALAVLLQECLSSSLKDLQTDTK